MALTVFAALTAPLPSQLDASFAAIGAMQVTACRATGTNSITLTPLANQPAIGAYANYMQFGFVAVGMSTATVTVQVGSLPQLNLYLADGVTQAGNGHLVGTVIYIIVYNSALGSAGGFQIVSQMPVSSLLDVLGTSQGSILYRGATAWSALAPGVKNSQLKSGGGSGNPFWALSTTQVVHSISFTSGGAFSFSSPSGLGASKVVKLTLVGGGGGGGAGSDPNGAGGGGEGAVAITYVSGLTANTTYSGAVGVGGNGGVSGGSAASGGGTTTISFGGVQFTAGGGQRGASSGNSGTGGSGASATNVLISIAGAPGWNGSQSAAIGGAGACGPFGGAAPWSSSAVGLAARGVGSGGAGGSSNNHNGGKGANGLVLMEWIE